MSQRETMKPDYQKPTELVFLEATQHILKHENCSFSRFSFSPRGKSLSRACPSWVPDFSAQKAWSPGNPNILTSAPDSKAPTSRVTTKLVSFQDHNRVLAITGVLFDTIEVVIELKDKLELILGQIPAGCKISQRLSVSADEIFRISVIS
jgi:hypothetical protein